MKLKEIKDMTLTQIWEKVQKPFNFAWKVGIIVIAVGIACGLFSELMSFICCSMADRLSDIEYLSENVEARYYTDGTCRLYKRYSDRELSKKLKFVDSCPMTDDCLTSYQDFNGKWGFVDMNTGKIVIPAVYEKVWDFTEGLAAVADAEHKVGFIDKTGELQIPMMDVDYKSGHYSFENGIAVLEAPGTGLKGAINKEGIWVLPMEFYNIFYPDDSGFMKVSDGEHWGLYDSAGHKIFPIIYDDIYYDKGLEAVFIQSDGIKQLLTISGDVIEPFVVDRIQSLRYLVNYHSESEIEYATHPYLVDYNIDIYHGVLDTRTGNVVIPAVYDSIEMISKDMFKASLGLENVESVLFDIKGNKIED